MLHSIRWRLLLTVGTVVAIALFAVGFLASRATRREFAHFITLQIPMNGDPIPGGTTEQLQEHYRVHGSWTGAKDLLNGIVGKQERMRAVVIVDSSGCVVGASDSGMACATGLLRSTA